MSDDYIRGVIPLKKSASLDQVRVAFRQALSRVLTSERIDEILDNKNYEDWIDLDEKQSLTLNFNSAFNDLTCRALARVLTPLANGPGYFQVFDDAQSPSAMILYPLGLTQKDMRNSRVLAAIDAACAMLSNEKDKTVVRRLRKFQAAELIP